MRLRYYRYSAATGLQKIKTKTAIVLSAIGLVIGGGAGLASLVFDTANADTSTINFESPAYSLGGINGQNGWSATGSAGSGCAQYDEGVSSSNGTTGFGSQSFRISNAVTSGCFGDQAFATPLANAVGEADSTAGSFSAGTLQRHFEMQFDVASATPGAQQSGLAISVSPDRGDGSRMSYLRFEDGTDGLDVYFDDVQGTTNPANFVETEVGTGLDRSVPHTIKLTLDALDGPSNDVVKVWIDGTLVHTGTSWENYYRYDSEASAEQSPRIIKTVLFRAGGTAVPSTNGNGFLFDNLTLSSGPVPPAVTATGHIVSPAANHHVTKTLNLKATYADGDTPNTDDAVQWAVRAGTCAAGTNTVFGNVDGHSDSYNWNGNKFTANLDIRALPAGQYCFVFNPTDDPGQPDVRLTQTFYVNAYVPNNERDCRGDNWKTYVTPSFSSRRDCEQWVNAEAAGDLRLAGPSQQIKFNVENTRQGNDGDNHMRINTVQYWNYDYPGGLQYTAAVTCSSINSATNEARFMFQIPDGHPGLSGLYVVAYVKDVHGKHAVDLYGHAATSDLATATQWCQTGAGFSPAMYTVTRGNVEVE
jgi:hypothetical protein